MAAVAVGYIGVPPQFIIGVVLVIGCLGTHQARGWQSTFIFIGQALMVCSVGLWLATRQVHQELRVRRRIRMSY